MRSTVAGLIWAGVAIGAFAVPAPAFEVHWVGEMRRVMRDGDLRATIGLRELADEEHLYALGPLEGLRGEITVWDGTPSVARVAGKTIEISDSFDVRACFLVYAAVESWHEVPIPAAVRDDRQLEQFVAAAAASYGIGLDRPFPFAVRAKVKAAAFHVVDKTDDSPHTMEQHDAIKVRFAITDTPARLVGFYSDRHHGVFTHHGTNVHMHVLSEDGQQSGHLDSLQLAPGGTLLLPGR